MSDSFDRMVVASRRQLRRTAEEVDSDAALQQIIDGHARIQRHADGGPAGSRGRWMLAIAAALIVVVAGLVVVQRRDDSPPTTVPTPPPSTLTPTPSTVSATTVVPTTVAATTQPPPPSSIVAPTTTTIGASAALSQAVQDITFVDAQHGWALVGADSNVLYATGDGGTTWTQQAVDAGDARYVRFADVDNGWIFAEGGRFQSTHDGGVTWHEVDLSGAGMRQGAQALATDGATVAIVAGVDAANQNVDWTVATSPVARDDFSATGVRLQQGAGPANEFELVSSTGHAWTVYNDRTVVGAARGSGGVWSDWAPSWADLGGGARLAVAPGGGPLFALVNAGEWTGPTLEYQLYRSDDNGDTFSRVTLPATDPATGGPQQLLAVDPGTLVVTVGQSDGSTVVYRSVDGGATWTPVSTFDDQGPVQLDFVDANTAFAAQLMADGSTARVVKSVDGGATWTPIVIAPPS